MKRLKVLMSAYACEPDKGSEPGVGWNWAKQIAKFAEVWVITRANNREPIEKELQRNPVANIHFIYYDIPKGISFWKRKERGLYLYYFLWQIGIYKLIKKLHRQTQFDISHHLTFGNIWLPTFLPFLSIPFVWGPVGGGDQIPRTFRQSYTLIAKVQEMIRDMMLASLRLNPFFLNVCRKANSIVVRTEKTLCRIPQAFRYKTVKMIETGIVVKDISYPKRESRNDNFIQIISVGRLIPLKGFDLALKSFFIASETNDNIRLSIVGDGPEKENLLKICKEGNTNKVRFTGFLEHNDVLKLMSESSIFLFPSIKEGGPWVLFEAMSLGLPIICLDVAGPGEIVNEQCGIKIKPVNPEQTIHDLSVAILKLASDPDLRRKMGVNGMKRVEVHFTWDKKGAYIHKIYENLINS